MSAWAEVIIVYFYYLTTVNTREWAVSMGDAAYFCQVTSFGGGGEWEWGGEATDDGPTATTGQSWMSRGAIRSRASCPKSP